MLLFILLAKVVDENKIFREIIKHNINFIDNILTP
jgi:hypothetical protein